MCLNPEYIGCFECANIDILLSNMNRRQRISEKKCITSGRKDNLTSKNIQRHFRSWVGLFSLFWSKRNHNFIWDMPTKSSLLPLHNIKFQKRKYKTQHEWYLRLLAQNHTKSIIPTIHLDYWDHKCLHYSKYYVYGLD